MWNKFKVHYFFLDLVIWILLIALLNKTKAERVDILNKYQEFILMLVIITNSVFCSDFLLLSIVIIDSFFTKIIAKNSEIEEVFALVVFSTIRLTVKQTR